MMDKKQENNSASSFGSLNEIKQFIDDLIAVNHKITPEEQKAFADAPTYDDMTEEDWKKEYEARNESERQFKEKARFNKLREFLHIGIVGKRDDPESELFKTTKELMAFVDKVESDPSSVNSYEQKKFKTDLIRYKELLLGEREQVKPPQQEVIEEQGKPTIQPIQQRFEFRPGQVLFDGKDLNVKTGLAQDVLKQLIEKFGLVVKFKELDESVESSDKEASVPLRDAISHLNKRLRDLPFKVENRRGYGYLISPS